MSTVVAIGSAGIGSLDLGTPVVMGVLNVTPDSFSDGGRSSRAMRRSSRRAA